MPEIWDCKFLSINFTGGRKIYRTIYSDNSEQYKKKKKLHNIEDPISAKTKVELPILSASHFFLNWVNNIMIMGKIFVVITKRSAIKQQKIKSLEQHFLEEFKPTCKNFGESELKQQKVT